MSKRKQRASVRFAAGAMERATLGLPCEVRDRYHDELVAEMHGLGRVAGWRYAIGVATSGPQLHEALTDGGPLAEPAARHPVGCRTDLHHTWQWCTTEDSTRYQACSRCGRMRPDNDPGPAWRAGGPC